MVRNGTMRGAVRKVEKPAEVLDPVAEFEQRVPIVAGDLCRAANSRTESGGVTLTAEEFGLYTLRLML